MYSGCRADANEAAIILLPSNVTVFTLDFSGSGLSDGDYVSLGWNEMEDLKAAVTFLRTEKHVSRIGLWGRSMGAVTCLMYGAQDPSIAGMVLDSPFSNLFDLMMELVDVYKIRLPKFTVKVAVQYMRKVIQKKAAFDIMDLDTVQVAGKSFIPALFGHATEDLFIQPHHSDLLFKAYSGDKNIIKFEGDHNSPRPQFYYDSITIFFYNVLRPPDEPVAPEAPDTVYFDTDGLEMDDDVDESILYEIMGAERPAAHGTPQTPTSTSSGPRQDGLTAESTEEALNQTRSRWQMSRTVVPVNTSNSQDDLSELLRGDLSTDGLEGSSSCAVLENGDSGNYRDDFARYRSSKDYSDSWGRHSSNGVSLDSSGMMSPRTEDSFAHFPSNRDDEERMVMEAIAASLQDVEIKETEQKEPAEVGSPTSEDTAAATRVDSFTQRMRLSFFRGMGSRRSASR
ncbi:hypothetical protein AXG93_4620s1430 [Marchantia polymorpha subsp. ruderalis]|uniref:Serine aminopeptidase S33 domain-containing protein n=1 Tax=Marchantia polymorpha subsp. ruderalis TaxID=1480154 RepID=A0A176VWY5_MARPO|nr:hypothetical protein AXG93_4620s1430 [Marchantia polymorpha subsp. ruderalis]